MAEAVAKDSPIGIGEEIRERMGSLTPSERRVGRALLATYPAAGLGSIVELAESAGVTAPTVLRFVRKLDYEGYSDFQRVLRDEVQARMSSPLTLYGSQTLRSGEGVLEESLKVFTRLLERTLRSVSPSEYRATVQLLADPRRQILFTGGRFSQLLAHYLYAQVRMLRGGCRLVGEGFDPRVQDLVDVSKDHVLCVFDYRRYQDDTIAFAKEAANRGAKIVLFTDPWLSPIAAFAHHVLVAFPDAPSPFDSMVGGLALTEVVLAGLVEPAGDGGRTRLEEFEAVWKPPVTDARATKTDGRSPAKRRSEQGAGRSERRT